MLPPRRHWCGRSAVPAPRPSRFPAGRCHAPARGFDRPARWAPSAACRPRPARFFLVAKLERVKNVHGARRTLSPRSMWPKRSTPAEIAAISLWCHKTVSGDYFRRAPPERTCSGRWDRSNVLILMEDKRNPGRQDGYGNFSHGRRGLGEPSLLSAPSQARMAPTPVGIATARSGC